MARVVLEKLAKIFRTSAKREVCAVQDASLVVEDGELLVLVGPSGCGKSTLLRMIAGVEEATNGSISMDGQVINAVPPQDRDVALVFQNHALYPHMTVYENLTFGLRLRRVPKTEIERRVRETVELLGLNACLDRLPEALSGGERQRVAVGRALVRQPKVYLLDEPLSNLDAPLRVQLRREICRIHGRLGATMLYVTHDQVEAMTMGNRIAVMNQGAILQVGQPLELYRHPANLFVAGFIGWPTMNFLEGTIRRDGTALCFAASPSPASPTPASLVLTLAEEWAGKLLGSIGSTVVLGIRPEHVRVSPSELALAAAGTTSQMEAVVDKVEPLGPETLLDLVMGEQVVVARVDSRDRWTVRQPVKVTFDLAQGHFFDPLTEKSIG